MMYRHLKTGIEAELVEKLENKVTLKVAETGEIKEVGLATFKRWWRAVKEESAKESESAEEVPAPKNQPENTEAESKQSESSKENEQTEEQAGTDEHKDVEGKALSLSEIINKLETLFDLLNRLYFESALPRPVITVQSTPRAYGHCSVKKIWNDKAEDENKGQYEINIGAEYLDRPSENTAATMLHEMVHLYCRENDLAETCQNGRYHNKLFKQECESRGLIIEYDRANGYSTTSPSDGFIESLRANGYVLEVPFARHTLVIEKRKALRVKAHKYICPDCGQEVKTTQELSLICGICNITMERAN